MSLLGLFSPSVADAATLDSIEQDLVSRINSFRAARALPTLAVSDSLTVAAKWMSADMGVNNYFAHTSLDGRSPTQRMADAGYPATATWTGENLAAGYTSTADVLAGWIASPGHYAVLVNPQYRAIGVGRGYTSGSSYGWYWTADFGGIVDAGRTGAAFDIGYHARWTGQTPDPTLAPGQTTTLVVALQNIGYRGWYAGVPNQQAALGTSAPLDVARPDLAFGWLSTSRIATTTTSYVGPGQVGWFQFTVRAPSSPGDYRLAVRGVIDGVTWLEDQGIFFTIHVR
ncbi:MAG TPA: CAP domain-containing protein [Candidatus Limnocylindria bacterium]|nr:CAP domain-containing protein [Candidatus Limnocylindria bacterium]